jgi:hypothetical protein
MHVFLFFIPGILLIFSKAFNKKPLTEFLIYVVGLSLSFFVVLPWFVKYLNVPLMLSAYLVFIFSSVLMVINIKRIDLKHLNADRQEILLMGIFLIVLLLRCLPMFFQIAPAGADMSMHSYIARLIYDNDGIPNSYRPLLPISNFGAYPSGFPTLSTLTSLLCDCPVYRSGLLMSCITHALICFGLYILLLRFFDRNTAAATSIAATFLTRSPQWIIRWGGNPTVLALFFFIIAFSLIIELKERPSWLKVIFASLSLAAVLITHSIIFYVGGIILAIYFLLSIKDYKYVYPTAACLFVFMLLFLLPYLANLKFTLSKSAIESTRAWQMVDAKSVVYDLAASIPFLLLSIFGLPLLLKKNRHMAFTFLSITAVLIVLTMNFRLWLMPFSYLLYPGRVALALIIPLAIFAAPSISKIISLQKKTLLISFVITGLFFYCAFYLYNSIAMCSVTRADLDAFKWMDNTISKSAVIMNNYGDAGLWIPAIIGRTIMNPHSEPVNYEELSARLRRYSADYIYIGSKAVYGNIRYKKEELQKYPLKYKLLYINDGAQIWKIL